MRIARPHGHVPRSTQCLGLAATESRSPSRQSTANPTSSSRTVRNQNNPHKGKHFTFRIDVFVREPVTRSHRDLADPAPYARRQRCGIRLLHERLEPEIAGSQNSIARGVRGQVHVCRPAFVEDHALVEKTPDRVRVRERRILVRYMNARPYVLAPRSQCSTSLPPSTWFCPLLQICRPCLGQQNPIVSSFPSEMRLKIGTTSARMTWEFGRPTAQIRGHASPPRPGPFRVSSSTTSDIRIDRPARDSNAPAIEWVWTTALTPVMRYSIRCNKVLAEGRG